MARASSGGNQKATDPVDGEGAAITPTNIRSYQDNFAADPSKQLMQNVVTKHDVNQVAMQRSIVAEATHSFSTVLDDWKVTNQSRTGRCWMFAGLNLVRSDTRNELNLKEFEFSQNYLMFWDKLEGANFVLEAVIETAALPLDDRTVAFLLQSPIEAAGNVDLCGSWGTKYVVVPQC